MPSGTQPESMTRDFASDAPLLDHAPCVALLLTPDGTISNLNQRMADSFGGQIAELKGTQVWSHLPTDGCALRQEFVQRRVRERKPYRQPTRYDGRWYDWCFTPRLSNEGEVVAVAIVGWDITERKQTQDALMEGDSRFRALLAHPLAAVAQVETATGRLVRVNQRFCAMFGYSARNC